ncbi:MULTISPECIES: alpha/beta hydrolase family protein [Spirosoma]|uniref:alpha/beta hydrolase family protein n=1 Tax=Spirosoma TaxID=107 RepID=UPI001F0CE68B|nr:MULTISPECIES: lipase family protein [Spirosoma]
MISTVKSFRYVWVLWLAVVLTACDNSTTDTPTPQNQYLVGNSQIAQLTKEQVVTQLSPFSAQLGGGIPIASFIQYGCTVHRITYKTKNVDGTDITASGAVLVPTRTGAFSAISVQHGTIFDEKEAPSYFVAGGESATVGVLGAALGYLVIYPDYIGYGESKQVPHPYEHRKTLASSTYDMIQATREFCTANNISWNNNLYLSGYSQGGGATMALQQKMETENSQPFTLKAVSAGAGAYDKLNFTKFVLGSPTSGLPLANSQYLWVMTTYNRIYNLNRPLSFFLKEPYASRVQTQGVLATIDVSFNQAATDGFKNGILNGTDTEFINALKDNDTYNFVPKTPTLLIYGTADQQVYPLNSENAFNAMKQKGATTVQLFPLQGQSHASAIPGYLLQTLQFFASIP